MTTGSSIGVGATNITTLGTITTGTWNASVITGTYGGTGVNNGASTITLGGSLTLSGAFATTITVTGITGVTLPTTGTLVNTAVTTLSSLSSIGTIGTGVWQGTVVAGQYGGTGVANTGLTITLGGNFATSGAFATTLTVTGVTNVTLPTSGTLATTSGASIPAIAQGDLLYGSGVNTLSALAKDTNATRYLSNTGASNNPAWAQIALATGVSGQLPLENGGTNANLTASNGGIFYSTATAGAILAGTATAGQMLQSGATAAPTWSTSTYPATNAINTLLYASSANVMSALATANNGTLITSSGGVPSISSTLPSAVQDNITRLGTIASGVWNGTVITQTYGGNGNSSTTAYAVQLGGTTSTGAHQDAGTGTSGFALISQGSAAKPVYAQIPGQNMIINGDMQIWQRGAGGAASFAVPASTTQYTADRWQILTNANQACTIAQSAGATSGSWLAKIQRNNGQTGTGVIEFCTSLTRDMCIGAAGNVITVSMKVKAGANFSAASSQIGIRVWTGTGTTDISGINGAFTGASAVIATTAVISSTLTSFAVSSAAVGSTVTQIACELNFTPVGTAGADDSFSVTDFQCEISPYQTPYQRRAFGDELALCKRFYQKTFLYGTAPAQNAGTGTGEFTFSAPKAGALLNYATYLLYPIELRANPTITYFNTAAANAQIRDQTAAADFTATASTISSAKGLTFQGTGNAATAVGNLCGVHMTFEADIV